MSDLNDLFKQLAEEKAKDPKYQQQAKIKENVRGDLGSLFSTLAEEKAKDPKVIAAKKLEKEIKEHVKTDLGSLFSELASLKKQKDVLIEEHPELIEEDVEDTTEFAPELVKEVITEVAPLPTPIGNVPAEVQIPDIDKYLKAPKQPQQEEPTPFSKEFKNVNDKIKFLEQWIGKIQNTGPGSGEVNLRYLDDVDRSTIVDGNFLTYNATTKKFEFRQISMSGDGTPQVQSDWTETNTGSAAFIKHKPTLFSGDYTDLSNLPILFSGDYEDLTNKPYSITWTTSTPGPANNFKTVISANDGYASITILDSVPPYLNGYIWKFDKTKITFPDNSTQTTAWTGTYSYNNLTDKPTIPAAQIQSDWNQTNTSALDYIKNKPTIPTEADTLDSVTDRGNSTTNAITVGSVTANYVQIDTTPSTTPTIVEGMIAWNAQEKTFDMGLIEGVVLQVGQETHMRVKAYEAITNGQSVMFAGVTGEHVLVRKYDPSVVGFIPEWFVGVATQDLAHNALGYVTVYGVVHDVNTNAWNEGQILYANNSVAGGLTTTEPTPGTPHIIVAAVTKKSGTGHILVRPNIRAKLDELSNVNITSPSSGQVLSYNGTIWVNANPFSGSYTDLTNKPTIPTTVTINGTSINLNGSGTVTADASTLTGTTLKSTVVNSSLTSVGTLTSLNTSGTVTSNAATAFVAGAAAESGVALEMPREGAIRNMTNGSNTMYFDVSNGGTAHGRFRFRSSSNFTEILDISTDGLRALSTYQGKTPFNSAIDTVVTVDNIKYRISNQGGVFPQIASASGSTVDVCYDVLGVVNGNTPASAQNSGYILAANGTWLSIYSSHGMDSRGDRLTAHITDKNAGKIYRATFMKTNNSSNQDGYNIIVERII